MADSDKQCLEELSACFPTTRGLSTNKGTAKVVSYSLFENRQEEAETLQEARKAVTLLRYTMLRPNTPLGILMDNVELTYLYAFALPPAGSNDYRIYQCWPNLNVEQEIWVSPEHQKFPLPGWHVDSQLVPTSTLEDIQEIEERFYVQRMSDQAETAILLAMEWYNQSFQRYTLRSIAGRLVDIATAFETLFQLPRHNKAAEFRNRIREYLAAQEDSIIDNWATDFYSNVRSETVHRGRPRSYLFKHPEAQIPHLSFIWSSQRIFRECIAAKIGFPRHIPNDRLVEDLIPNEVHLTKLKEAGSFEKILESNLLEEVHKLKAIYPAGERAHVIWLGKELLRGYKEQYKPEQQSLPTLEHILNSDDTGSDLGVKYYRFQKEFRPIYPNISISVDWGEVSEGAIGKLRPITRANIGQLQLESAIYHFAGFAGWALLTPS